MDTHLKAPLVSVIMPVYNCGAFVREAIDSILDQTLSDFELLIIDDCSTDNTLAVITSYSDPRIRVIQKKKNTGYVDSLNTALAISRGEYLARMDGDDISVITRLEKQVSFLRDNADIALCGTWYQMLHSGKIIQHPTDHEAIKIALLDYCAVGHPTVMVRKNFIDAHKLTYKPDYRPAEDYELWTRIAAHGKMANVPEVLLLYRSHEGQVSSQEREKQLSNSLICQKRMLCYPLAEVSDRDLSLSAVVASGGTIYDPVLLAEVVYWLEKVCTSNESAHFYETVRFNRYIDQKKAGFIRTFYLHTTAYNPAVLARFLRARSRFRTYFSFTEQIKLALKCLIFWKPGLMN
jgi:glycosyltransferase involved in cell wall biosynthesis